MTNDEIAALAWVGAESQRLMKLTGVPFVVLGVVSLVPSFVVASQLQVWLFGVANVKLSALVACAPTVGLVVAGWKISERVREWRLPSIIQSAALRFAVDERTLRDVFLPGDP